MGVQLQLKDLRTGEERTLVFEQSPIRIGRNQLNNVVITDSHVSEWHGIIRFDGNGVFYFDLGSTNGTHLEGECLAKNTATPLGPLSQLRLWPIQITVSSDGLAPAVRVTGETIAWGASKRPMMTAVRNVGSGSMAVPSAARPGPEIPSFQQGSGTRPPVSPTAPPYIGPQSRESKLLEDFSEAFIGLKKGYEQFGAEVGVRPLGGGTPLHRAHTSREVIEYLLDPNADAEARGRELKAVFADMGIHHIALMEGLTQSVRSLLESLDPAAQTTPTNPGLFSSSRAKAEWRDYVERFEDLIAEDAALHAEVFGEEFARAYASVALGSSGPEGDEEQ